MNRDLIFDALEGIDDDMLREVDSLRARKILTPRRTWLQYVSAAACACFILGGAFAISRYETPSRFGTEETTEPMDMSGQGFIHNYIRAEISLSYSGSTPRVITEPKEVTALFDVLKMVENTEEAESSVTKDNHDNGEAESERIFGAVPGTAGSTTYIIVLISSDGEEVRYTLSGNVLISESTDKSYRLSREHYSALTELINLK